MPFIWVFKHVLSYSKPHIFSTFFGEEKERKHAYTLSNQATKKLNKTIGKIKKVKFKNTWEKNKSTNIFCL